MFCKKCGNELPGAAKFCPNCGIAINAESRKQTMDFVNPTDGSTYSMDFDPQKIPELNMECQYDDEYEKWIDDLPLNTGKWTGYLRDVLKGLVKWTVKVGRMIFNIGKIVLNGVIKIISQYPATMGGIFVGFILGLILSQIPFIGWALGPLVVPLFAAAGGVMGFMADTSRHINNAENETNLRSQTQEMFSAMGFAFK